MSNQNVQDHTSSEEGEDLHVDNGLQSEKSLSSRDGTSHGRPEGSASQGRSDSVGEPSAGELDRSRDGSPILDGSIQPDPEEEFDPRQQITQTVAISHEGPLPEPSQLAAYAKAGADFPERIVRMAEKQIDARIESMTRLSKADSFATRAGMITIGGLAALGLVGAFVGGVIYGVPGAFTLVALPVLGYLPKLIDAIKGNDASE